MSANQFGGLAWSIVNKQFGAGVRLVETPALVIATTPPQQILLNNPDRVFWLLMNLSPYYGVVAFNDTVTLTTGLIVAGLGGFVSASVFEDGELVTYPLWAVESAISQTWYVAEVMRV